MTDAITTLDRWLKSKGFKIEGVSLDGASYKVWPASLQAACQADIDAFDVNDPVHEAANLDATVRAEVDRRFMAAYTWVLLKRLFPSDTDAQTKTKLAAIRDAVITAYLAQPWTS